VIRLLAFRHLVVRPARAAVLLAGYGVGVGVMIVLLAVGEAMLEQSRDVALVGGGEITVLPEGIDVEALRTGAMSSYFYGVDRARFVQRQLLEGPRRRGIVRSAAPAIEHKLLYLESAGRVVALRAGGEIPSRGEAAGAGLEVVSGTWVDTPADSAWMAPTAQALYDELDRFHSPPARDSTWGEWQYFNVVTGPEEWWYISYLVGGEIPGGRWGGQLLVTHRRPDGVHDRYLSEVTPDAIQIDSAGADLILGANQVRQRDGRYQLTGSARGPGGRPLRFSLRVDPAANRWFPPVELRDGVLQSGYVVPAVRAEASGEICVAGQCRQGAAGPAYHDHNWGVWRGVTWEWGMGRGTNYDLLYGGVIAADSTVSGSSPFFLALVDSLGVRQVLRFATIKYEPAGSPVPGALAAAPGRFAIVAARDADTLTIRVEVSATHASRMDGGAFRRTFLQMRGRFTVEGRVGGHPVRDEGLGFFETWRGVEQRTP